MTGVLPVITLSPRDYDAVLFDMDGLLTKSASVHQGPVISMIENYRSEMLWQLMRKWRYVAGGLRRVGFDGGWL